MPQKVIKLPYLTLLARQNEEWTRIIDPFLASFRNPIPGLKSDSKIPISIAIRIKAILIASRIVFGFA